MSATMYACPNCVNGSGTVYRGGSTGSQLYTYSGGASDTDVWINTAISTGANYNGTCWVYW